jgi:hypothetical protein
MRAGTGPATMGWDGLPPERHRPGDRPMTSVAAPLGDVASAEREVPDVAERPVPARPVDGPRADRLWRRWVVANALGEALGLGLAAVPGIALLDPDAPALPPLLTAGGMVAGGCLEGHVVGTAQWLALRRALPRLTRRAWVAASVAGAALAWALGMLPSTLMAGDGAGDGGPGGLAEASDP